MAGTLAFSDLKIETFRALRNVRLEQLCAFNLFVGANNCGKTSVLEAVGIVARPFDAFLLRHHAEEREPAASAVDNVWGWFPCAPALLPESSCAADALAISATTRDGSRRVQARATVSPRLPPGSTAAAEEDGPWLSIDTTLEHEGRSPVVRHVRMSEHSWDERGAADAAEPVVSWAGPDAHRHAGNMANDFQCVTNFGETQRLVDLLVHFDSDIEGISAIPARGKVTFRVAHRDRGEVALSTFGEGLRRAFALGAALIRARDGVLLIDELEVAVHRAKLATLINWVADAARQLRVQVFATTHSADAIEACLEAYSSRPSELAAYRLRRDDRGIVAFRNDYSFLSKMRSEGLDLR